jgi:HSP20 family protein
VDITHKEVHMLLLRNDPIGRDFGSLVESLWGSGLLDGAHGLRWVSDKQVPAPEWTEEDGRLVLAVPVPGLAADQVEVEIHGRRLSLRADRRIEVPDGYQALLRERSSWSVSRAWDLPDTVDADSLTAQLADGVLRVTLGRKEAAKPRRITVDRANLIEHKEES